MARPKRCRRICGEPEYIEFVPGGCTGSEAYTVTLSLDEFEAIRLVDYEKKTHEQCAAMMDISRTTVTEIYERARGKVADCLVNGKKLVIAGGNYRVSGEASGTGNTIVLNEKGGPEIMRIAVTYENGQIFQHFGHTSQFKVYDVEDAFSAHFSSKRSQAAEKSHSSLLSFPNTRRPRSGEHSSPCAVAVGLT